jgi:hypothetical protein
LPHL